MYTNKKKAKFMHYWYTSLECLQNGYIKLARKYENKASLYYEGWSITKEGIVL